MINSIQNDLESLNGSESSVLITKRNRMIDLFVKQKKEDPKYISLLKEDKDKEKEKDKVNVLSEYQKKQLLQVINYKL